METSSPSRKPTIDASPPTRPRKFITDHVVNAPSMMRSPWVMLMTPTTPQIIVNPSAIDA